LEFNHHGKRCLPNANASTDGHAGTYTNTYSCTYRHTDAHAGSYRYADGDALHWERHILGRSDCDQRHGNCGAVPQLDSGLGTSKSTDKHHAYSN
jgi:hypothetical protein